MNIPLQHYHYDVFKAENVLEDILIISLPVKFKIEDGKVTEAAVRFETMVPDIVFTKYIS